MNGLQERCWPAGTLLGLACPTGRKGCWSLSLFFGLMRMAALTMAEIVVTPVCLRIHQRFMHCSGNVTIIIYYATYNALFYYIFSNN